MKKIILVPLLSFSVALSGCTALGAAGALASAATAVGAESSAPLQRTVIDDKAIVFAFHSFEAFLSLIDAAQQAGWLKRNSPEALKVQFYVKQVRYWLPVASSAQKAGSVAQYDLAFEHASKAMEQAKNALAEARR